VQRLRELAERLAEAIPGLRGRLGERPELQISAFGASLATHLVLLFVLGMMTYAATRPTVPEFRTEVVDTSIDDFAKLEDTTAIASVQEDTTIVPVAGSFAPQATGLIVDTPPPPVEPPRAPEIQAEAVQIASLQLPKATRLDTMVEIRGTGAEHTENVEGAVDRVAVEILRRLEKGRTLVVWAFDASGSLQAERAKLAKYIDTVYQHIDQLDHDGLARDEALLTSVVAFGEDRKILLESPTTDRAAIVKAIGAVGLDKSGTETTFRTVGEIARKFGKFNRNGNAYHAMCVVVTDEVGDDQEMIEPAIASANAVKMPVYVLGTAALFGRVKGYQDYKDPETGFVHRGLEVTQGPEAAELENIALPFWYDGPQYDLIDAGFGPWGLSRLAGATGGIYFITRASSGRITFDPAGMREYKPDWVSREQYHQMLARHPLRQAVMRAATITQQALPPQPTLTFPPIEAPNFKDAMSEGQRAVARVQYTVDEALGFTGSGPGQPTIVAVAKLRDREPSRRWQAHYDLVRGRLLAMKIRCMEYNIACARMKKDAPRFTKPGSNAWRLVPDETVHISEEAQKVAVETRELLARVIKEHPGTPWALLAQRELKDPFGLKWVEVTLPPPPPPGDGGGGDNNNNNNKAPKPPPPPKL
jgi:hypothetical protein